MKIELDRTEAQVAAVILQEWVEHYAHPRHKWLKKANDVAAKIIISVMSDKGDIS